jgi:opacity protein-like surface antigen
MNKRRFALMTLSLTMLAALPALARAADAVTWTTTAVPVKTADGSQAWRLEFTGRIDPGYIIYGSDFEANLGPNPTRVRYEPADAVKPADTLKSAGTRKGKDKAFNTDYTYFEGEAKLSQVITVAAGTRKVTGTLRGQTCHEADGTCTLFRAPFDISLP